MLLRITSPLAGEVDAFFAAGEGCIIMALKRFKKQLRKQQTDAESILWYHLRNRGMDGYRFRRQHVLKGFIADFVCLEKSLVIELDGGHHSDQTEYDLTRSRILQREGFTVIRFWNDEIMYHLDDVLQSLWNALNTPHPPQKTRRPLPQGERSS